ncbi:MAG: hypothetical protein ACTHJW_11825 [Streptosporangiaceae bacterium]
MFRLHIEGKRILDVRRRRDGQHRERPDELGVNDLAINIPDAEEPGTMADE